MVAVLEVLDDVEVVVGTEPGDLVDLVLPGEFELLGEVGNLAVSEGQLTSSCCRALVMRIT